MVANQGMHASAFPARLLLERFQVLDDGNAVRAPVGHITGLHEVRVVPCPLSPLADQAGVGQHLEILLVVTVQVANGNNARYLVPFQRCLVGTHHAAKQGG